MSTVRDRARTAARLQMLAEYYRARARGYAGKLRRALEQDARTLETIAATLLCMRREPTRQLRAARC